MQRIRLVVLLLATALVGTAVTAGSASARGNVLPDATYAAVLAVSTASVPFDRDGPTTAKQLATLRGACRAVPRSGALLTSMRRGCDASYAAYVATTGPCESERQCLRTFGRMADATERVLRSTTESNRVIAREVPAGACRVALLASPAEIKMTRELVAAIRVVQRAMRKGDPAAIEAAVKRIERIDHSKARSAVQIRNAIRDRC